MNWVRRIGWIWFVFINNFQASANCFYLIYCATRSIALAFLPIQQAQKRCRKEAKKVLAQQVFKEQAAEAGNQNATAYTNQLEDMRQMF